MKESNDSASIHVQVFNTSSGNYYAYDPFSSKILTIDNDLLNGVDESRIKQKIREYLEENSITKVGTFDRFKWYEDFSSDFGNTLNSIILQITRRCNLDCTYCIYSGNYVHMLPHADIDMTEETMKQGIDFFIEHCTSSEVINIAFYGGEALLKFDMIKSGIIYARSKIGERKISFTISSNGTTLNEQVVNWLSDNPDVSVAVTINGPFHDQYRKTIDGHGSLNSIMEKLDYIKTNYPHVWENQVTFISNISSEYQIEKLRKFYTDFIGKSPNLITSIRNTMENQVIDNILSEYNYEADIDINLRNEYVSSRDSFLSTYFDSNLYIIHSRYIFGDESSINYVNSCIPLSFRLFLSARGTFNICEQVSDGLCIGDLKDGINWQKIKSLYDNMTRFLKNQCHNCWAQRLCYLCFQNIIDENGEIIDRIPENWCEKTRNKIINNLILYCELAEHSPERLENL